MIERVDISLLEKYLAGEVDELLDENGVALTPEEIEVVIDEYKELQIHLEGAALKAQLKERHGAGAPKLRKSKRMNWLAAAAVMALAITFAFFWQGNAGPQFDDYFSHFNQLERNRGDASSSYTAALEAYSRRNYEEAFNLFSKLEDAPIEASFFEGVSALAADRAQLAINAFLKAGVDPMNRYYQQTRWYLALAYWQAGEVEKARKYWSSIPEGEFNFELAQALLRLL